MNDTVSFEDRFLYNFSGYQTRILHSKFLTLILLCLVLTNSLFSTILSGGLSVNYPPNIETTIQSKS